MLLVRLGAHSSQSCAFWQWNCHPTS